MRRTETFSNGIFASKEKSGKKINEITLKRFLRRNDKENKNEEESLGIFSFVLFQSDICLTKTLGNANNMNPFARV